MENIKNRVTEFLNNGSSSKDEGRSLFREVCNLLESGEIRSAEKINGKWIANKWVKEAILIGFKFGELKELKENGWNFFDKDTLSLHNFSSENKVRLVPGGSSVRCGSYIAPGTIIMPPSYINIGAYIDSGCMIDSHALVGSCAQIGKNVHLSAASQVGGVLEPVGALPVIIENNVFIGGNCGIYEGTIVQENAVLGTGVILNSATPVFDSISGEFIKKSETGQLIIPRNAVIVAGSRPMQTGKGKDFGIHIYCPIIIKYRDSKTNISIVLEDLLR